MTKLSIVVSLQKVHMEIAQFEKNRKKLSPAGAFGTSSLRYVLEKSQPQIFPNSSPKNECQLFQSRGADLGSDSPFPFACIHYDLKGKADPRSSLLL